ncbi:Uncharacterised protein [Vibrio cholerae]|nr:Uncharacterised protein [Vibrio cholerae]
MVGHLFHAWRCHDFHAHLRYSDVNFNLFVVQLPFTQLFTKYLAGAGVLLFLLCLSPRIAWWRQQRIQYALFR